MLSWRELSSPGGVQSGPGGGCSSRVAPADSEKFTADNNISYFSLGCACNLHLLKAVCDGLLCLLSWFLLCGRELYGKKQLTHCHRLDEQCEGGGGEEEEVRVGGCGGGNIGRSNQHLTLAR